jgi:tRNA pseudouridine38-40 synthase
VEEIISKLNELVQLYLGTHSFHNFTKGYKTNDPRCDRYIMGMSVEKIEEEVIEKCLI